MHSRELLPAEPWPAEIESSSRALLIAEVGRAMRAGELAATGALYRTREGRWAVPVLRLKDRPPEPPAWRTPVLIGAGVLVGFGGVALIGWALAMWAASLAGALMVPVLAIGAMAWAIMRAAGRSRPSGCTTTVTITHRGHR
jgi:hypothetical protein